MTEKFVQEQNPIGELLPPLPRTRNHYIITLNETKQKVATASKLTSKLCTTTK